MQRLRVLSVFHLLLFALRMRLATLVLLLVTLLMATLAIHMVPISTTSMLPSQQLVATTLLQQALVSTRTAMTIPGPQAPTSRSWSVRHGRGGVGRRGMRRGRVLLRIKLDKKSRH